CRQGAPPVTVEVVADYAKQKQDHDACPESDDLDDALTASSTEVGNAKSPGNANTAAQAARKKDEQRPSKPQNEQDYSKTAYEAQQRPPATDYPIDAKSDHRNAWAEGKQ